MSEVKISAEPRTEFGKGGARRTRRAGKVPAVLYGHGEAPKHISLPALEFAAAIRHGGANQLFNIAVTDGTQTLALAKAIQRDPIRDTFEHVDLIIVKRGEKVTVDVPVIITGEAAKGTLVMVDHDRVSVLADATKLPENLEANLDGKEAGSHVTAGELPLPTGAELITDPETVVITIALAPTAEDLEGDTATEEAPAAAEERAEEPVAAQA